MPSYTRGALQVLAAHPQFFFFFFNYETTPERPHATRNVNITSTRTRGCPQILRNDASSRDWHSHSDVISRSAPLFSLTMRTVREITTPAPRCPVDRQKSPPRSICRRAALSKYGRSRFAWATSVYIDGWAVEKVGGERANKVCLFWERAEVVACRWFWNWQCERSKWLSRL